MTSGGPRVQKRVCVCVVCAGYEAGREVGGKGRAGVSQTEKTASVRDAGGQGHTPARMRFTGQ